MTDTLAWTQTARCRATALSSRFKHCVHAYYGVPAFSRDGSKLLYLAFDSPDRGNIVVRDLQSDDETVVGETTRFDFHTAAGQRWVLDDTAVIYRTWDMPNQPIAPMLVKPDGTGEPESIEPLAGAGIRHVSIDGRTCFGSRQRGDDVCLVRSDLAERTVEVFATHHDVVAQLPEDRRPTTGDFAFNHPVSSHDDKRLFFKLMHAPPNEPMRFHSFCVADLESGDIRDFGNRISGHPWWMPDNHHILNIKGPRDGSDNRHLVLVDGVTGEDRKLIDAPLEGPGHPTVSPDGKHVITDAFTADGETAIIYLIEIATGIMREVARLPHRFKPTDGYHPEQITRGQPHPTWSACGQRVLINFNYAGDHMGLVILDDLGR